MNYETREEKDNAQNIKMGDREYQRYKNFSSRSWKTYVRASFKLSLKYRELREEQSDLISCENKN